MTIPEVSVAHVHQRSEEDIVLHDGTHQSVTDPYFEAESVFQAYINSNASAISTELYSKIDPVVLSSVKVSLGPGRTFGTEPLGWEELKDIVNNKKDFSVLTRSIQGEKVYSVYKEHVTRTWKSMYHHVLHHKFQFEKRLCYESTEPRWEAHPKLGDQNCAQVRLLPNDFPYFLANNIEHWCLWKLKGDIAEEDLLVAKEQLVAMKSTHGTLLDLLSWINPPNLKSLPEIDHAHLIVLRQQVEY
jgi:hypothetical protein